MPIDVGPLTCETSDNAACQPILQMVYENVFVRYLPLPLPKEIISSAWPGGLCSSSLANLKSL